MEVIAKYLYVKSSPQKLRLVVDLIRGKNVNLALNILNFTNKKAALFVIKVLNSAIANAKHNYNYDVSKLIISKVYVDGASSLKRLVPRAKGRANYILKRMSHITIFVSYVKLNKLIGNINGTESKS